MAEGGACGASGAQPGGPEGKVFGEGSHATPLMSSMAYADHTAHGSFMQCLFRSVSLCERSFDGEGFRTCVHGVLLTNDLLPAGVSGGVREVDGAFGFGLELSCPVNVSIGNVPRFV